VVSASPRPESETSGVETVTLSTSSGRVWVTRVRNEARVEATAWLLTMTWLSSRRVAARLSIRATAFAERTAAGPRLRSSVMFAISSHPAWTG
jgi:hypothetical protein